MIFLYILLIIFILLISTVIMSTLIKLSLLATIKYNYDNRLLMLPSLLSFISWIVLVIVGIYIIMQFTNIGFWDSLLYISILPSIFSANILPILLVTTGLCIFGILIQSLITLLLNVDYNKLKNNIRVLTKSYKNVTTNETTELVTVNSIPKLRFGNSFIASLFSFSLMFFGTIIFFIVGYTLSEKILSIIT